MLVWERYRVPDELWHQVDAGMRHAACGFSLVGRDSVQVVVVRPEASVRDYGRGDVRLHLDLWPDRHLAGRTPLCHGCAVKAWERCQ